MSNELINEEDDILEIMDGSPGFDPVMLRVRKTLVKKTGERRLAISLTTGELDSEDAQEGDVMDLDHNFGGILLNFLNKWVPVSYKPKTVIRTMMKVEIDDKVIYENADAFDRSKYQGVMATREVKVEIREIS